MEWRVETKVLEILTKRCWMESKSKRIGGKGQVR